MLDTLKKKLLTAALPRLDLPSQLEPENFQQMLGLRKPSSSTLCTVTGPHIRVPQTNDLELGMFSETQIHPLL